MTLVFPAAPNAAQDVALAPVLPPRGWISPDVDARLKTLARAAQAGNLAARNALYTAFAPRLAPMTARERRRINRPWMDPALEPDDIDQEAFLVFVALVAAWPGDGSFTGYVLARFPWRLRDVSRGSARFGSDRRRPFPPRRDWLDGSADSAAAVALLEALAGDIPSPRREILLWHVRDGDPFVDIARRLGVGKRQVMRQWRRIRSELRRSLASG
jgi:DNA-directed RNA polymerase specialized sigma24 family protein